MNIPENKTSFLSISKGTDKNTNCEYIFTTFKKSFNNKRIVPKIKLTGSSYKKSTSIFDYIKKHKSIYTINGGLFHTKTTIPECLLIKNGKIIFDRNEKYVHINENDGEEKRDVLYNLGIDKNGDLKFFHPKIKAEQMLKEGIIDAVMGFGPLIINNVPFIDIDANVPFGSYIKKPRQIIGQFKNMDYFALTILEPGMTYEECRNLLKELNVYNAYSLDGGSSTQTAFKNEMLTTIKRNDEFRKIPTIITFVEEKMPKTF